MASRDWHRKATSPDPKVRNLFFIPRCLAIFIAQALSHDHFAERSSMIWAAS